MIRFSDISYDSFLGRCLRKCLAVVPQNWEIPILQGPLRGTRWIVGAQTHGMWLGSYEAEKQLAISGMLHPGEVFYDIGANTGFFSLLGVKSVGKNGKVIAVEPLPRNVEFINKHVKINNVTNIVVVDAAISAFNGIARFSLEGNSTSKISETGVLEVRVKTLDTLVEELGAIPDVLKVDIEGEELNLMHGATNTLRMYKPIIFMSIHSEEIFNGLLRVLPPLGYAMRNVDKTRMKDDFCSEVLLTPDDWTD